MHRVHRLLANAHLTSGVPAKYREIADEYLQKQCTTWMHAYIEAARNEGLQKEAVIARFLAQKPRQDFFLKTMDESLGRWLTRHSTAISKNVHPMFLRDV